MAEQKTAAKRTAKRTSGEASGTFTDEEKAAAKERVKEMRRSPRASKADGERDVLEKISEMDSTDRVMAERIHAIVTASAPDLTPRTWYGMPAYAKDGTIVCHFRAEVQDEVPDARLQRQGEPRRRHRVAGRLRPDQADQGRRGQDRGIGQEGGELTQGRQLTAA